MAIKPIEILIKARDEASGIFGSLQGKVAAVGAALAGYFGISAFVGAVKGAAELEAKLSEVKAVSGATAQEMVQLRKAAEDAGAATKYTATEGAEALGNLTRAGLSAKDAIAALPAVLNLAQAGGIELGAASEYVTKAVQGMGLKFSEAGRVADVLALGANASNASVTGLAQALSYAAPVANAVGLSLESTVAIIGKFSDAGIDASRAGTALNAVLSQFSDPASKFRQELGAAGIITNNFETALHQLAAAGPAGEKAILAVGTEAGPAMRALLGQGIGALDELKTKLQDAGGSAAATAAIMEDNLNGSFNGLSSAWDTVKNTLATPVLPVLRDAVTALADSLRGAVSNGTIGKFGDAIATAFQAGLKWAKEFLGAVDFVALTAKMQAWADRAGETFTKVGEYASNAGNIVQTAYGVMSAGANTVLAVIYTVAQAFGNFAAGAQSGLALLLEGMAKITFGDISASFKAAAEEMRISAGATGAVAEAFAAKASAAFDSAAEGAEIARKGFDGLSSATAASNSQAAASTTVMQAVAISLADAGKAATEAGDKAKAAAQVQQQAVDQTRAAVAELRKEYDAALAAGDVQLAVQKLAELNKALRGTADTAKAAADKARDVEQAFSRLGVTSTAELVKQREAAERDYKIIRDSGLGTVADLRNAWAVYSEKAIAANGGVATETLKSEAAMQGLKITTDAAGKSIVESMGAGTNATNNLGRSAADATDEFRRLLAVQQQLKPPSTAGGIGPSGADNKPGGKPEFNDKGERIGAITGTYGLNLPFELYNKQQTGRLSANDLDAAKNALAAAEANARMGSAGSVSLEGRRDDQAWLGRLRRIVDEAQALTDAEKNPAKPPSGIAPQSSTITTPTATATPVIINLGSTSTRVNVASPADATALQNLLAQLMAAKGTAA